MCVSLFFTFSVSLSRCFSVSVRLAMAGLHASLRGSSSSSSQSFSSKLLLLLTLLPLTLAAFAFVLQWRGGVTDPATRWSPEAHKFPGMDSSPPTTIGHSSASDCVLLSRGSSPSFPYYRDWKFDVGSDLRPKVRFWTGIFVFGGNCFWGFLILVDFWWVLLDLVI